MKNIYWKEEGVLDFRFTDFKNEGQKAQSQARIMGYSMFREPTLWQHCRCQLFIDKSEFYLESYNNNSQIWVTMADMKLYFKSVREVM